VGKIGFATFAAWARRAHDFAHAHIPSRRVRAHPTVLRHMALQARYRGSCPLPAGERAAPRLQRQEMGEGVRIQSAPPVTPSPQPSPQMGRGSARDRCAIVNIIAKVRSAIRFAAWCNALHLSRPRGWRHNYAAHSVGSPPPCGEGLGVGGWSRWTHLAQQLRPPPRTPSLRFGGRPSPQGGGCRPSVSLAIDSTRPKFS
jgi:hypothetical protein